MRVDIGRHTLYRGDCLELLDDLKADAVISDPPYGMNWDPDSSRFSDGHYANTRGRGIGTWKRVRGDDKPFDPAPWLGYKAVLLFGCNHFGQRLPVGTTLVWLKKYKFGGFLSDAELAWMKGGHGVYCHTDASLNGKGLINGRVHPTEKPVGVMAWAIAKAVKGPGQVILDPYMGSGTTGVAAIDAGAVAWLNQLIAMGALPDGEVDSRSIADVRRGDLEGMAQCHFFCGVGGWPYALKLAGWDATRPVWSASLPCQAWSCAGQRKGEDDERHLWPIFRDLVERCKPPIIFGEQVASADAVGPTERIDTSIEQAYGRLIANLDETAGRAWLTIVRPDLESLGYRVSASDLPAAGIGAPHIRQRLYWCALRLSDAKCEGLEGTARASVQGRSDGPAGCGNERLAHSHGNEPGAGHIEPNVGTDRGDEVGGVDFTESVGRSGRFELHGEHDRQVAPGGRNTGGPGDSELYGSHAFLLFGGKKEKGRMLESKGSGSPNCHGPGRSERDWSDVVYIPCADNKARPIPRMAQPGSGEMASVLSPLVVRGSNLGVPEEEIDPDYSAEARTMRLKGYGNSVNLQLAAEFVRSVMEYLDEKAVENERNLSDTPIRQEKRHAVENTDRHGEDVGPSGNLDRPHECSMDRRSERKSKMTGDGKHISFWRDLQGSKLGISRRYRGQPCVYDEMIALGYKLDGVCVEGASYACACVAVAELAGFGQAAVVKRYLASALLVFLRYLWAAFGIHFAISGEGWRRPWRLVGSAVSYQFNRG